MVRDGRTSLDCHLEVIMHLDNMYDIILFIRCILILLLNYAIMESNKIISVKRVSK